jgi:hypothetical protein
MMRPAPIGFALTALVLGGCVAPELCTQEAYGETLQSGALTEAAEFANAGESRAVRLRATLRHLSELWPAEYALGGALQVTLHVSYVEPIDIGGAATEMPRFSVALGTEASPSRQMSTTPAFPASSGTSVGLSLFQECWDGDTLDCCEYGASECSATILLEYERIDGEPFPAAELRWEATASASVGTCPPSENAELLLELEEP